MVDRARPTVDVWVYGGPCPGIPVVAGISWLVYSKKSCIVYATKMGYLLTQEVSKIEPITVEKKYFEYKILFTVHMDTIAYLCLQILALCDVVIPHPTTIDFPLLLPDIPSVNIQAYSLETVIAEKFHDDDRPDVTQQSHEGFFFDCYQLLTKSRTNDDALHDAIEATFDNRRFWHTNS